MKTTLSQWLCLLWNIAPPLHLNSELPCLMAGAIHLPPQSSWRHHRAAAAHAAAHLVYSPRGFEGHGLGPIARALAGLLEDARVEALALRELPGLARLWRP
ncbi:MAG: VWA domain-containing protein, partial [Betaproteobacteria bacterium]